MTRDIFILQITEYIYSYSIAIQYVKVLGLYFHAEIQRRAIARSRAAHSWNRGGEQAHVYHMRIHKIRRYAIPT